MTQEEDDKLNHSTESMEFGTSKEIELLDSSDGDPSVSDARLTQNSKQV